MMFDTDTPHSLLNTLCQQGTPKGGGGASSRDVVGGSGGGGAGDGFLVTISASGRDPRDPTKVVHAISVQQPVQSWVVIREYGDFFQAGHSLSSIIAGLPPCPTAPKSVYSSGDEAVGAARNALQEWFISVLLFPGVRESPAIRHFLSHDANVVPPQYQGVAWLTFPAASDVNASSSAAAANKAEHDYTTTTTRDNTAAAAGRNLSLDEMEMDEMFDTGGSFDGDEDDDEDVDDDDDSNEEVLPYNMRYPPPDALLTKEDRMEIHGEVEMVEDVGSLAQSLGASHLGRSLQLQAQIAHLKETSTAAAAAPPLEGQGVRLGGPAAQTAANSTNGNGSGGIGGAVENAKVNHDSSPVTPPPQGTIAGIGDSFDRRAPISAPRLDSFEMIKVIGKGSFGKVFLVREKRTAEMFALKVLTKENIIKRNQVEHTKTERSVLGYVKHPFIVAMNMAFQSKDKLYFVLDYCAGGELFFHLGKLGKFPEARACFYAAEIVMALSYVHELDIIYRDLKPENVLLDAKGHIRLTDFGLSKEGITGSSSGAYSFCGTPEYLAPEILNRQGHGRAVDWWSLGALLYEMLTGLPPFYCRDREKLFEKIRKSELTYPRYLSVPAQTLLRGLLTKAPSRRLGSGPKDATEIKSQAFFSEVDWEKLARGQVAPPWDPQISGSLDTSQFDHEFTSMPMCSPESVKPHGGFGQTPQDNVFEGFTFTDRTFHHPGMET